MVVINRTTTKVADTINNIKITSAILTTPTLGRTEPINTAGEVEVDTRVSTEMTKMDTNASPAKCDLPPKQKCTSIESKLTALSPIWGISTRATLTEDTKSSTQIILIPKHKISTERRSTCRSLVSKSMFILTGGSLSGALVGTKSTLLEMG